MDLKTENNDSDGLDQSTSVLSLFTRRRLLLEHRICPDPTIDALPDDTLLEIFDFYRLDVMDPNDCSWTWHTLVHVCRRWRDIVFASPRSLDLRLLCKHGTPVRDGLSYWPPFPIIVNYASDRKNVLPTHEDHILVALAHPDRVCRVEVVGWSWIFQTLKTVMQQPFPELTHLRWCKDFGPTFTNKFLGGSVSHLRSLSLRRISFPALPRILPTATDLVSLRLLELEMGGASHIQSRVMITCLSKLPRLEHVTIHFCLDGRYRAEEQCPLPSTRVILPSLTEFDFLGFSGYLDDLVARIDTPSVKTFSATVFTHPLIPLLHFSNFVLRTGGHTLPDNATVYSDGGTVSISLHWPEVASGDSKDQLFRLGVSCDPKNWKVRNLVHLGRMCLPALLANLERLSITAKLPRRSSGDDDSDSLHWLTFLRLFTSVDTLYVCEAMGPHISLALETAAKRMEMGTLGQEVLPAMRNIQFGYSGSSQRMIPERFVAMRQLSGHPVIVRH